MARPRYEIFLYVKTVRWRIIRSIIWDIKTNKTKKPSVNVHTYQAMHSSFPTAPNG